MSEQPKRSKVTAGIIIIGDEVLKGHVQDINSHYLCQQLWELGVRVGRISVVADDLSGIAEEVKRMAPLYDFVFTTGGIGPTHDDVTMEAVGMAFGEELHPHPEVLQALSIDSFSDTDSGWKKMVMVPKSTKIYNQTDDNGHFFFLLMVVRNVHCYPGVPSLVRGIFQSCKDLYSISNTRFFLREFFFSCDEDMLADPLTRVQAEYPDVQLGSYPNVSVTSTMNHLVKITFESDNREQVDKAYSRLLLSLPVDVMMSAKDNYSHTDTSLMESRKVVSWMFDRLPSNQFTLVGRLCQRLHKSVAILESLLDKYSFNEICVAFNGGKDCTVILYLLHAILERRNHNFSEGKLQVLFVDHTTFKETETFVEESSLRYGLDVIRIKGSIRDALSELKSSHPHLKAVCMGTRSTDPHSDKLVPFSPTDSSWPEYMRVHCILDWSYSDVWQFLKLFRVPYCKLYDRGYTSLDGVQDTLPNPALLINNPKALNSDLCDYLPAYMLSDEGLERAGRTR
ncbi:FAD synthase-like isoform X2 [Halichondria panicea]|uniref:FAD synthase-like isoform X2 n=1 Tax=Halichondria panicea TaxID=6063 RepID=UPI00312B3254